MPGLMAACVSGVIMLHGFVINCPPEEYASGQLPEHVITETLPAQHMPAVCGRRALACSKLNYIGDTCIKYMPNDVPADVYSALDMHETAHCRGWRHK